MSVRMLKGALAAVGLTLALSIVSPMTNIASAQDDKTVRLALLDWTGQEISNKIAGEILTRMGYTVEYVQTTQFPMFQAIADGDIDAYMEQWLVTSRHAYEEFEAKGELESLGTLGIDGVEAWFYPTYVEADCPGLPDWKALAECEDLFASPETYPNGRVVDYPADWTPDSAKWAEALGLDMTAVPAGGEGAIVAEIKSAFARNEPVMVMFWKPHWVFADYDMKKVEMPTFEEACETDASWGVNPDMTFDCGAPIPPIIKVTRPSLADDHPEAYNFLKAYTLNNEIQESLMKRVDQGGEDVDVVVKDWVDGNQDVWQPWVDQASM